MKKDKYSHGSGTNNYDNGKDYNNGSKSYSNGNGNSKSNGDESSSGIGSSGSNRSSSSGSNSQSTTSSKGTLQFRFNNGQCTDWADARYAQLTGHHVAWSGDALTWTSSARNTAGWAVSSQPKAPSIIVIQPGNQGVGSDGHVAVVERIESDGEVYTSNYNYNGGPYVKTYVTFKTGNGVSFIWHD
ncbi:hypothetical protein K493DRAFT_348246 [Basidiobolus meristosporus CBS 931.73]|uniref:Peptidase C51 domain-containing protein n=1 Tax=Basidiobolus meristosporus CBS 931.73 TaxID=1314790 RepID=A0A1Y1YPH5_9FUNG|nr:hypothetical protein K493DRAFT_348246 [Basidiobolus meristosporus CBS 931.73]|eukprot:ORX99940.1 hypothetical protein K493DRAFT_348246 [Basidiobolus meristosporus CBS 931.73]